MKMHIPNSTLQESRNNIVIPSPLSEKPLNIPHALRYCGMASSVINPANLPGRII
jgi:hypothetical protein